MQRWTTGPRAGLDREAIERALSLRDGGVFRHGVDVLDLVDAPTGDELPVEAAGWVRWSYRPPDRVTGADARVAEVRRQCQLVLAGHVSLNLLARRYRPWTDVLIGERSVSETVDVGPLPYADVVAESAPVGWWRLGEASGTTAADSSGNGHDGTYVGPPTLGTPGAVVADDDTAPRFGGSHYVDLDAHAGIVAVAAFSAVCWFRQPDTENGWPNLIGMDYTSTDGWSLHLADQTVGQMLRLRVDTSAADNQTGPGRTATDTNGEWRQGAVVADQGAGTFQVYLDGALLTTVTPNGWPAGTPSRLRIGPSGIVGTTLNPVDGIDEPAVYDRALTADEIARHFEAGRARLRDYATVTRTVDEWARFHLGVFTADTVPAIVDDGIVVRRTLTLPDKSHRWANTILQEPVHVPAGTAVVDWVKADLTARFGETRFAIPSSTDTLAEGLTFEPGTSWLEVYSRLLEAIGYDQLSADDDGRPTTVSLASLAGKGPEHTYGAGAGKVLTAGEMSALLPTLPNVVRFSARQGPSLGNVEGNGLATRRNQSTGPASIDALGEERAITVDVAADSQAALEAVADADAQRYFAGGGRTWRGKVAINPRHGNRDVISLDLPRLGANGGAWLVTDWQLNRGPFESEGDALMDVVAEERVSL